MLLCNQRQGNRPAPSLEFKRLEHVMRGDAYAHESLAAHPIGMQLIAGMMKTQLQAFRTVVFTAH